MGLKSHGRSLRRKRLCRLRLELGPGLGLSLNSQLLEIPPVAHVVAENLIFSGQVLRRKSPLLASRSKSGAQSPLKTGLTLLANASKARSKSAVVMHSA
ncbi:hypothetical protein ABIF90_008842 [Bradyrhizobium japonicum]